MDLSKIEWLDPPETAPGEKHLNCCQKTLLGCCGVLDMTPQEAEGLGAYFGGGMRCKETCGPAVAALMLLGRLYGDDPAEADRGKEFLTAFAQKNGTWLCGELRDEEHVRCEAAIQFAIDYVRALAR